jgi:hypothetical protein
VELSLITVQPTASTLRLRIPILIKPHSIQYRHRQSKLCDKRRALFPHHSFAHEVQSFRVLSLALASSLVLACRFACWGPQVINRAGILQPCDPENRFSPTFPVGPSSLYCCRFGFGSPTSPPQLCSISGKRSNRPRALSLLPLLSISLLLRHECDTRHSPIGATDIPLARRHPL